MAVSGGSSSSNLTIGIRADSSKLRADMALAEAQVRNLGKELRTTANAALATGDTAGVQNLATAFENARARVTGLRGEIATLSGVGKHFAPANAAIADMHAGFGRVGASVSNLVNTLLPGFGSKFQLGLAGAALALGKMATSAAHGVTELENLSKVTGFSITTLDGLKDVFAGVVDRDDIGRAVVKFSEELGKARLEAAKTGPEVVKNVTMIRGSLTQAGKDVGEGARQMVGDVEVLRGAGRQVRDVGDAFKAVGVDVRNFTADEKGNEAALIAFSKALSAIPDKTEKARIGMDMFGKSWALMGAGFIDLDKTLSAAIANNLKSGLGITPQMIADAKQYRIEVAELADAWEDTSRKVGSTLVPHMTWAVQKTGESFDNMRVTVEAFGGLVKAVWEKIRSDYGTQIDAIVAATNAAIPVLQDIFQGYFQFLYDAFTGVASWWVARIKDAIYWVSYFIGLAQQARDAVGGLFSPAPAATAPIPAQNNAAGGLIGGYGTGDTVRAMLTPGEFVQKVAAVRYYGVDFMRRLNALQIPRFEMGGIVDSLRDGLSMPTQRFAMGGMVASIGASGSGSMDRVAVDLTWNGASFAMIAPRQVAEKFGEHARRQQMLSAIKKPSSYR